MPFTPAHAVVALPFAGGRRISMAAVAAGAVVPDAPLFLTGGVGYGVTHALWAVPTLDVLLGAACLVVWWLLLRPALVALLPSRVRVRVPARRSFPVALIPVAIAGGALTHVVWDAFTHRGRFGTALVPALADRLGPLPLTSWAQHGSGLVGLAVLMTAAAIALRRAPEVAEPAASTPWIRTGRVVVLTSAAGGALVGAFALKAPPALSAVTTGTDAAIASLAAIGALMAVRRRRSTR